MATVKAYETASGTRYRVRYRKPDGAQTDKRGFRTKRDANLFLAGVEVKKATGEYIDPSRGRETISTLVATWFAARTDLKPSSRRVMEVTWRVHGDPEWSNVTVGQVTRERVQEWIAALHTGSEDEGLKGRSASTVRRAHGILLSVLDDAVRDRRIPTNPARGLSLPRATPRKARYLTHEQVEALANASGEHSTLIYVLAYSALRWGEATELRAADIDLTKRRITVSRNAVRVGQETVIGTPKTHKQRTVPFPAFLAPKLEALIDGSDPTALLFSDAQGQHLITPTSYKYTWYKRALKTAGLPSDLTIHDLRHTAASLAVSAGANVKAVQRMLGHASAAMTLDLYADLFDDDLDAVAVALDAARAKSNVGKMWANTPGDEESAATE